MPYKFLFLTFALIWSQTPVRVEAAIEFANPEQFVASKESDLVAILKTTSVRNVLLLDEDITPALVSECIMEEAIDGSKSWPSGTKQTLAQWDACSSPMDPAAPPILEERRYLVWAHQTPNGLSNVSFDWFALPDGCFLIRDHPKGAFIYWEGNCYLVSEIRKSLGSIGGQDLPREHEPNVASEKSNSPYTQGFSQKASDVEESPKGSPPVDPTQVENVRQLLGNPDPEERAQGLVQAGILGLDEFYENIKKTALNGDQTERLAAISSLGFYDRPLETEYLNRLIGNDEDLMVKLGALELATRREPSRFIDDAIETAHTLSDRFDLDRDENGFLTQGEDEFLVITRILNRMPRSGLPPSMIEGLSDSNPEIRWMMANGFWVGGKSLRGPASGRDKRRSKP